MDVSGLKKVHITGPHAAHLIDLATTRDVEKIYPGKSAYACMLNEAGKFTDDCIIYRISPNSWMVVHGSGTGHEELQRAAMGRDVSIRFDDNLHDLSLQGPLAVDYLAKHVPGIRDLPLFPSHADAAVRPAGDDLAHRLHRRARLRDLLPRPGRRHDLGHASSTRARAMGIIPCRFTTLDMLRVESYLLFYPYDNSQKYPFDERRPRRHAVGARPRLHRQPRQDRLPRRRGALPPEGQGALQDLRRAARRQGAGRRGRAGLSRRQEGRRRHLRHVFAAGQEIDGHRPARRRLRRRRARRSRSATRAASIKATAQPLPFDDPKKTKRTAKG